MIPPRPDPATAPLSFIQRQMWLVDQMEPGNPAYNFPWGLRLSGQLHVAALEAAFNAVIRRHEILRTTFVEEGGEPHQRIHPALAIGIEVRALTDLAPEEREAAVQALATEASVRPFDLSRLPLIRVTLLTLGPADHVLIVNLHHILADGLSIALLVADLDAAYRALVAGRDPELPALRLQYGDFAHWQREAWADLSAHADTIAYWQQLLGGELPVLELPGDRPRPTVQSFQGSSFYHRIPAEVVESVRQLAARERCTEFTVLLAAFQVLLARYTETTDLVVGTPLGFREREELEPLIGNFLTMAALRSDLSGEPTFLEVIHRGRAATLDALDHFAPLPVVLQGLAIERIAGQNPLFQVLFDLQRYPATTLGDLKVDRFFFDLGFAQLDLSVHVVDVGDGYVARFEYRTDLFDLATIERIANAFTELIRDAVTRPDLPMTSLRVLPAPERERILTASRGPATAVASAPIHALVEAQAERTPERIAVQDDHGSLTYAALEARSNELARALRARGARRGERIGVCLARDRDLPATLLGILKTGAAYVPLDPGYPASRLRFMAEDGRLSLLVSTEALASWCPLPRERQLLLDADRPAIAEAPMGSPGSGDRAGPEDPAYLIYTSGSEGTPKGVVVGHGAVVNFLTSMADAPGIEVEDVLLAVTTISFDIAGLELFLPLCVGATVVLATTDEARDGLALRSLLARHQVTVMQATPVTWRLLLEAGWEVGDGPFKALVGGEALPRDLAEALLARGVELWNMYGPTETTIWSTCARIRDLTTGITIGWPIANTTVRVLDARRNLSPAGAAGELYIGGSGVALGYWDRPELTAQRFIPDPEGAPGARLYRTGDRVRLRGDGGLEHLGRLDDQVKLRGFRIELREIEANLMRHPGIREAAVAVRPGPLGDPQLVAYLVVDPGRPAAVDDVRTRLREALPEFMVPARYMVLEALPRTANGKRDDRALPVPDPIVPIREVAARPRTPTEGLVLEAFRDILRRADAGVAENFFDLGGDSLMAARLVLRLRAECRCDIPLRLLFERQTPAGLADAIATLAVTAPLLRAEGSTGRGERVEVEL